MSFRVIEVANEEGVASAARAVNGRMKRKIAEYIPYFAFELGLRYKYYKNLIRYNPESVADPLEPIWIDPNEVEYMIDTPRGMTFPTGPGYIRDGDWDERKEPVEDHEIYIGLVERFVEQKEWSETEYVERAKRRIEKNGEFWNYIDLEEFLRQRTAYVEQLYNDMQNKGYRVAHARDSNDLDETRHETEYHAKTLEPVVAIGKYGDILFVDGFHRFAIARLLNIDIPVHVLARHIEWQTVRETIVRREDLELPAELANHPDLQDVQ